MRILVCPPTFFGVDYVINPWMEGQLGRVDRTRAQAQWNELVEDDEQKIARPRQVYLGEDKRPYIEIGKRN